MCRATVENNGDFVFVFLWEDSEPTLSLLLEPSRYFENPASLYLRFHETDGEGVATELVSRRPLRKDDDLDRDHVVQLFYRRAAELFPREPEFRLSYP